MRKCEKVIKLLQKFGNLHKNSEKLSVIICKLYIIIIIC